MHSICVFCGSRTGHDPDWSASAEAIGRLLGRQGRHLVFGGGKVGLMGVVADAALAQGGTVTGIIPEHLMRREVAHTGVQLEVVPDMLTRKQRMMDLADAAVTLPGGLGSLDELLEVMTWRQLGQLDAPLALFNQKNYYGPLLAQFEQAVTAGFMDRAHLDLIRVVEDMDELAHWLDATAASGAAGAGT